MTAQPSQPQPDLPSELNVKIMTAENLVYEGRATALSSLNEKGPFDILPYHSNFIAIIKNYLTIHEMDGKKNEMKLDIGILRATSNKVQIFLGIQVDTLIAPTPVIEEDHKKKKKQNEKEPTPVQLPQPVQKNNPLYGG